MYIAIKPIVICITYPGIECVLGDLHRSKACSAFIIGLSLQQTDQGFCNIRPGASSGDDKAVLEESYKRGCLLALVDSVLF